jgi:hypothetical protein
MNIAPLMRRKLSCFFNSSHQDQTAGPTCFSERQEAGHFPDAKEATGYGRNCWRRRETENWFQLRRIGPRTFAPSEEGPVLICGFFTSA